MTSKKFFQLLLFKIFIIILIFSCVNFIIDPYGIFKKNMDKQILEPNKNYIKTKYILDHKNEYDAFILGSSRVGYIPVDKVLGYKFYNMTYSEGLPKEWLETLKTFIENDVKIKVLIIGIDDLSFKVNPIEHFSQPMRIPYQQLKLLRYKLKNYIFINPFNVYNKETINGLMKKEDINSYKTIYTTGSNISKETENIDKNIDKNKEKYVLDKKFLQTSYGEKEFINIDENIKVIENIQNISKENGIELIVIFNPLHKTAYINNNRAEYEKIKEKINDVLKCKIYDFSESESISNNNYYWYETSHFRPVVGEMILKTIFKDKFNASKDIFIPDDFLSNRK